MSTRTQALFGWVALVVWISLGTAQQVSDKPCPDVPSQATLDKTRFTGVWYEHYYLPGPLKFSKTCVWNGLEILDNGDMLTTDYFRINGIPLNLTSRLVFSFADEPARFKLIQLLPEDASPLFVLPFDDLKVVGTDYDTYCIFYECSGTQDSRAENLFIHSRRADGLDSDTFERIKKNLLDMGVRLDTLEKVHHDNCPDICYPDCPEQCPAFEPSFKNT